MRTAAPWNGRVILPKRSAGAPAGLSVNMIVNFSNGTGALTATKLNNGTHGNLGGGTWSEATTINYTNIEDHAVKLPFDLSLGGTLYGGPAGIQGKGATFDLSGAPTTDDVFTYALAGAVTNCVGLYLVQSNTVLSGTPTSYHNDTFSIASSNYIIAQLRQLFYDVKQFTPHSESSLGRAISADAAQWYLAAIFHDVAGQTGQVIIQEINDSGGGVWVLGDIAGAGNTTDSAAPFNDIGTIKFQSYSRGANMGTGDIKVKLAAFLESTTWPPYALTVPTPTSPSATQTGLDEVTFTWESPCQIFKIERKTGAGSFVTLEAEYDSQGVLEYVDSTVSNNTLYTYRVSAIIGSATSATAEDSVTTDNTPFLPVNWSDTMAGASTDARSFQSDSASQVAVVANTNSGSCTKLRVWIYEYGFNTAVKAALYDASHNLLGSGSATATATGWLEITLSAPVSVTATNYEILARAAGPGVDFGILASQPANSSFWDLTTSYAAIPVNPWINNGGLPWKMAYGMGVI